MRAGQAQVPESNSVGAELIGDEQFWRETPFPEELAHQPECRPLVAAALNQHVENLALMIDGAPQVHALAGNPDRHLIKVPSIARAWPTAPQVSGDPGPEFQNPAPHGFIRSLQPSLGQEILHIAIAQVRRRYSRIACWIMGAGKR